MHEGVRDLSRPGSLGRAGKDQYMSEGSECVANERTQIDEGTIYKQYNGEVSCRSYKREEGRRDDCIHLMQHCGAYDARTGASGRLVMRELCG